MRRKKADDELPWVVVSDLHVGCGMAIMPEGGFTGDTGVHYEPSEMQSKLHDRWKNGFWKWVERECPSGYNMIVNGDLIDGSHHDGVTQWSHNILDQRRACVKLLEPVRKNANRFLVVRGTEVHVGKSGQHDEAIAEALNAEKAPCGTWSHWEIFLRFGGALTHVAHHVGTSSSPFSKSSPLRRVMALSYINSGRWGDEPPVMFIRSHAHTCSWVGEPCRGGGEDYETGVVTVVVTPPWQLKTPYSHRLGIQEQPEYGGVIIKAGDNGTYMKPWVGRVERPREV